MLSKQRCVGLQKSWPILGMQKAWQVHGPYRIDCLSGGSFLHTFRNEHNRLQCAQYYELALASGSNVYAVILVPAGKHVGSQIVRRAFTMSMERQSVYEIVSGLHGAWKVKVCLECL